MRLNRGKRRQGSEEEDDDDDDEEEGGDGFGSPVQWDKLGGGDEDPSLP